MQTRTRHLLTPLAVAGLLALGACGGGGGDDSPPPAPTPLTVGGTAATGAPLSGGAVAVECASGSATATTAADGGYSVTLAAATAPCLVRVTAGPTTYYSLVAAGSTSPATVNLTPLTTLLATQVLGADPAAAFDDFDAAAQGRLTATAVSTAREDLEESLAGQIDLTGIDPITTPFVVGDATDQLLDDFGAALTAAQLTLPELAAALLANPGLPEVVQTALAPAASSCPSLRTGPAVFITLGGFITGTVDSAALTTTYDGNALPTETLTDLGNCGFSSSSGSTSVVSPSAVAVNRVPAGGGNFQMAFGFPRQELPLSALAGDWSYVLYVSENGEPWAPGHGSFTINGSGRYTGDFEFCAGLDDCETEAFGPTDVLAVVPPEDGGGFIETNTLNRVFAYRAPNGTTMLFIAIDSQDGVDEVGFAVATKQTTLARPEVGQVTPFSQFSINGSGLAGAFSSDVSTVTAVDAGADSFTRTLLNGAAQTFRLNSPRAGMAYRAAGSSPDSMGTPVPFNATLQLRPPGTGVVLSISAAEGQNFFTATAFTPEPAAP